MQNGAFFLLARLGLAPGLDAQGQAQEHAVHVPVSRHSSPVHLSKKVALKLDMVYSIYRKDDVLGVQSKTTWDLV